jgi:autotransporter-associated beta strand protein
MKIRNNPFFRPAPLAASLVIVLSGSVFAATYEWNGSSSSVWTLAGNWSTGTGLTAGPAPTGSSTIHRVNIKSGASNTGREAIYTAALGTSSYGDVNVRGLVIGNTASGTLRITGGKIIGKGGGTNRDLVGNGSGTSTLIVDGGEYENLTSGLTLGIGGGPICVFTVNSGLAAATTVNLNNTTGTINLNGGTLATNAITRLNVAGTAAGEGTATLNLNGGTLRARQNNAAFVTGLSAVNVSSGGAIIDTNNFDVTIGNALRDGGGGGGLTKNSAGTLTLTAAPAYTGATVINGGTLALNPSSAYSYSNTISGAGALAIGGQVTLAGANTYLGATNVNSGTLTLSGSLTSSITVASGAKLGGEGSTTGSLDFTGNSIFSFDAGTPGAFSAASIDATGAIVSFAPIGSGGGSGIVVMQAAGGITGTIGTEFLGNSRVSLSYNVDQTQLLADFTPASLTWTGADPTNPSFWDSDVTSNWTSGGSASTFLAGDNVLFDDTASSFTVALQAELLPGTVTFDHSANDYTVSGAAIGGAANLVKSGSSILSLNNANTYSGNTTISGGTLVMGNAAALGSTAGGTTVTSGGKLDINNKNLGTEVVTISGTGDGTGALVNNGAEQINALGRLVLGGDASIGGVTRWDLRNSSPTLDMGTGVGSPFTLTKTGASYVGLVGVAVSNPGNIDVAQGTFSIQTGTTMGGTSDNTITVRNGATLSSWQAANPTAWSLDLKGGATLRAESAALATNNRWGGPVTLEDAGIITIQADGTMTISGAMSGTGSAITKTGTGVTFLAGANSYTGLTQVNAGSLVAQNPSALGTPDAGAVVANAARVELDNTTILGEAASISGDGGNFFGALQGRAGTSVWTGDVTVQANQTRIGAQIGASLEVSGVISSPTEHNVIFRPADATSTVILSGGNTYTGPTSIIGGVVSVSSLNSVVGGSATSNLGAPTTVANGTIKMGVGAAGILRYTGSGEITDRVIDLQGTTHGATLDQSGSGLLKFTSDLTATGVGSKTLALQGSTAGTGEMAGAIADNPTTGTTLLNASFATGATTITLNSVTGISVGASISGAGIAAATTVTAVNASTRVVTLSAATTGAGAVNDIITVAGVTNSSLIAKAGSGTWTLSGANTFTGGVTISGGVLRIVRADALGTGAKIVTINASANKWLELDGTAGNITLPASLSFQTSGVNGVVRSSGGDNVIDGTFTMTLGNGSSKIISDNAGSLTLNGNIAANTTTRALDLSGDSIGNNAFNGVLSNASTPGLTKSGSGKWTLNGINLYAGPTIVSGGTLAIGATGSIDASTSLDLAAGATLDTTAKASYAVPAALTVRLDGDTDLSGRIDATGQALDIDGTTVTFTTTGTLDAPAYVLADYGSISGTAAFVSATAPDGYSLDYAYNGGTQIALVQIPASGFGSWIGGFGLAVGDQDPTDDPDSDGVDNLTEFALNGDPSDGSNNGLTAMLVQDASAPAGNELTLIAAVRNGAAFAPGTGDVQTATIDGIVYAIEGSTDLVFPGSAVSVVGSASNTAPAATGLPTLPGGSEWEYRTFKLDASEGLPGKGFLRAKVTAAP